VGTASPLSNSTVGDVGSQAVSPTEKSTPEEDAKSTGKLKSLIYGTKEGREMDQEMEHSFSQVLARGKYVHSIVFHQVKPDKVDEYVDLVGGWYPRMAGMQENKVHLVGSWRTEVGDCDTFGKSITGDTTLCWPSGGHCRRGRPSIPRPDSIESLLMVMASAHLGIPALPRLPRLPPLHRLASRIPRL
jgi:hypothetical protein